MPQCSDEHWAWRSSCQHIMKTSPFQRVLQALCVTKQVGSRKQIKPNKVRYSIYLVSPWSWKWRSIPTRLWGFHRLMLLNFIKWFKRSTDANQPLIVHPTLRREQPECKKMQNNTFHLYINIHIYIQLYKYLYFTRYYVYIFVSLCIVHIDP